MNKRLSILLLIGIGVLTILLTLQATAEETQRIGDFSTSNVTVSNSTPELGELITYTLVAKNSSGVDTVYPVFAGQMLTTGQTFASAEVVSIDKATQLDFTIHPSHGITWTGPISAGGVITLSLSVTIANDFNGVSIDNTFHVQSGLASTLKTVSVKVAGKGLLYLPVIYKGLVAPTMQAITGGDDGAYTISWQENNSSLNSAIYTLEESGTSDFASFNVIYSGQSTSLPVTNKPGGTYYYRVKVTGNGATSPYSNIVSVFVTRFSADSTSLTLGNCTTLRWDFTNIQSIFVRLGHGYELRSTSGQSSATICPTITTTYELKVTLAGGSEVTHTEVVTVSGSGCNNNSDPYITKFESNKNVVKSGEVFEIEWEAWCTNLIQLRVDRHNDGVYDETVNLEGSGKVDYTVGETTRYTLRVGRVNNVGREAWVESPSIIIVRE